MIPITRMAALAAALALGATPAGAVVVTGAYNGVVTSGHAQGAFGYATRTDVTGMAVSGSFTYDLGDATSCGSSPWFACFSVPRAMTIVQTLNGVSETFAVTDVPPGSPFYNASSGGVVHDRLIVETIEFAVRTALGAPATVYDQYEIYLGAKLPNGRTWPDYLADGAPSWDGAVTSGGVGSMPIPNMTAQINETIIYQLTAGDFTKDTRFRFDLQQLTMGQSATAVPEPESWTMLILGFGLAGALMRRRGTAGARTQPQSQLTRSLTAKSALG
ncbi:PEPxxWA-CTERM sorting domain-containing protein [Phenylobacterium sp.]|uniref:PEPxxWA-CTERM sorting domain-containing protein n=1 Tax=Phenylobacterium sp. TaxID=1871053 RepID=UPI00286E3AAB|nr:PEPxxWA-CTERM sorting domain-containing protein [Phenylobacterium sp.]